MSDVATAPRSSTPANFPERKLEIGAVAPAIWRTFKRHPWTFYGLSVIPILLAVVTFSAQFAGQRSGQPMRGLAIAFTVLQYLAQFLCQNAIIFGTGQVMGGERVTIGQALGVSLRRFLPYIAATILTTLIILLGLVLLIIPGFIAAAALMMVPAACVIERCGPIKSIKRSAALTKGNRWRVIGAVLLIIFVPFIILMIAFSIVFAIIAAIHVPFLFVIPALVGVLGYPALLALFYILFGVLFVQLRTLKEGAGPNRNVTQVFD